MTPVKKYHPQMNAEQKAKGRSLRMQGAKYKDIAKAIGSTMDACRKMFKDVPCPVENRGRHNKNRFSRSVGWKDDYE